MATLMNAAGPTRYLLFGGYEGAERRLCAFLPDWQEEDDFLEDPEGPVTAIQADYAADASITHRDILGGLMGLGITREKLGDILIHPGYCQVLVLRELSGLSYQEIGARLDLDLGTVKSRIARARLALRKILLQDGNFFGVPASNPSEREEKGGARRGAL